MSDLKEALSRYVQEQTPTTPPPFDGANARDRHRSHRRMAIIAAVPVLLVATLVGVQLVNDPAAGRRSAQTPSSSPASKQPVQPVQPFAPGSSQGPISPNSSASCVEGYDLTTLQGRAFAFDGTVTSTAAMRAPDDGSGALPGYLTVTFTVHEWFRGGDKATVTVDMMSGPTTGTVSSPEGTSFGLGTRLLVSGEPRFGGRPLQDPIAWGCGFTRNSDQATAAAWRQTFGKK